jgi:hypothetical protein
LVDSFSISGKSYLCQDIDSASLMAFQLPHYQAYLYIVQFPVFVFLHIFYRTLIIIIIRLLRLILCCRLHCRCYLKKKKKKNFLLDISFSFLSDTILTIRPLIFDRTPYHSGIDVLSLSSSNQISATVKLMI